MKQFCVVTIWLPDVQNYSVNTFTGAFSSERFLTGDFLISSMTIIDTFTVEPSFFCLSSSHFINNYHLSPPFPPYISLPLSVITPPSVQPSVHAACLCASSDKCLFSTLSFLCITEQAEEQPFTSVQVEDIVVDIVDVLIY